MIELRIRPMETDEDGWTEVCLIVEPLAGDDEEPEEAEGETVGYLRAVEGTEDGPVTWYDARVVWEGGVQHRRFISQEAALLALASRPHLPVDARKLVGWSR
jgi:hypothetical protein